MKTEQVKLSEIQFDESIYPRKTHNPSKVQEYAENISAIEEMQNFIHVSANKKLLDGRHRHLAYLKLHPNDQDFFITVFEHDIVDPKDEYLKAIELNSSHGQQLSQEDKRQNVINLYSKHGMPLGDIAKKVSVSKQKALDWTKTIRDNEEKQINEKIFEMYLACFTYDEIAEKIAVAHSTITDKIDKFVRNSSTEPNRTKFLAHQDESFQLPIYNIWNFAKKTNETAHPGNTEARIVDNLLYLYTKTFDIVFDPFGGGGSTIDICKKRYRRYWVSDLNPIVERANEIRKLDIVKDLPPMNKRWSEVQLTYLDPPYWKQVEGKYSNSPDDLANMSLQDFNEALSGIVNRIAEKQNNGYIALIIQPTQWKAENREIVDHVLDMVKLCDNKKLNLETRISCPYATEQYTPQMVEWAKENKKLLVLTRELIVWRLQ